MHNFLNITNVVMVLQTILTLIILSQLRKTLKTAGLLPKWDKLIWTGVFLCIALIVLNSILEENVQVAIWLSHALFFSLLYLIFTQKEFLSAKPLVYALLPLTAINFIEDVVKAVDHDFYKSTEDYFGTAVMFAVVWMIAMLIINNKQKKELENERLKNEEKEKEYKITETLKAALEVQVKERTAELTRQKEELEQTLNELKSAQSQLIQSEKMASLGELTAGIAHEIQNPLNFVNNFSEVSKELLDEMKAEMDMGNGEAARDLADDVIQNLEKINHHGKRADAIVKGMLQHSRASSNEKEPVDINALCDEYLRLSYHGLRAKDKSFNATLKTDFDESVKKINIVPQDVGRVIMNLLTNAFYAVTEKKVEMVAAGLKYEPSVSINTKKVPEGVEIRVCDNGKGIPEEITEKIFQPFFTTKPTGKGTGLGLSLSYDIITKGHNGELKVETETKENDSENTGTTFIISLPE
jgi:two-component system NtrC family sensor kinase